MIVVHLTKIEKLNIMLGLGTTLKMVFQIIVIFAG